MSSPLSGIDTTSIRTNSSNVQDKNKKINELQGLSKEFEAIFIAQMLSAMRSSVQKGGFISGGFGEDIYQSMMDQELAKIMSEKNDNGISKILFEQLKGNLAVK